MAGVGSTVAGAGNNTSSNNAQYRERKEETGEEAVENDCMFVRVGRYVRETLSPIYIAVEVGVLHLHT